MDKEIPAHCEGLQSSDPPRELLPSPVMALIAPAVFKPAG